VPSVMSGLLCSIRGQRTDKWLRSGKVLEVALRVIDFWSPHLPWAFLNDLETFSKIKRRPGVDRVALSSNGTKTALFLSKPQPAIAARGVGEGAGGVRVEGAAEIRGPRVRRACGNGKEQ
jgi:hypothetical protein